MVGYPAETPRPSAATCGRSHFAASDVDFLNSNLDRVVRYPSRSFWGLLVAACLARPAQGEGGSRDNTDCDLADVNPAKSHGEPRLARVAVMPS